MTAPTEPGTGSGFTVVEVTIVMSIAMIVMASLLGLLTSQSRAAARVEAFVENQEQVQLTLVELQRDLRSATAIVEPLPDVDRATRVDLDVYADPDAIAPTRIRWRITTDSQLVRENVAPDGSVQVTASLNGVTSDADLFRYFTAHATEALAPDESAGTIADCTVRVAIDLRAAPNPASTTVRLAGDVHLRNRLQGRSGC